MEQTAPARAAARRSERWSPSSSWTTLVSSTTTAIGGSVVQTAPSSTCPNRVRKPKTRNSGNQISLSAQPGYPAGRPSIFEPSRIRGRRGPCGAMVRYARARERRLDDGERAHPEIVRCATDVGSELPVKPLPPTVVSCDSVPIEYSATSRARRCIFTRSSRGVRLRDLMIAGGAGVAVLCGFGLDITSAGVERRSISSSCCRPSCSCRRRSWLR